MCTGSVPFARQRFVTNNTVANPTSQEHTPESWYDERRRQKVERKSTDRTNKDVPALRQSKIRGREMVFSLLVTAKAEEEDMVRH